MKNGVLKLGMADFAKGLLVAVIVGVLTYLAQVMNVPGFAFTRDVFNECFKFAVVSGIGYLIKNFLSDDKGNVLGVTK
jgi:hypothetical protein